MTSKEKIDLEVGKLDDMIVDHIEQHHLTKIDTTRFRRHLTGFVKMSPEKIAEVGMVTPESVRAIESNLKSAIRDVIGELTDLVERYKAESGLRTSEIDEYEIQSMNYTGDYDDFLKHILIERIIGVEDADLFAGNWAYTYNVYEKARNSSLDDFYIFFYSFDEDRIYNTIKVYNLGRVANELMAEGKIKD